MEDLENTDEALAQRVQKGDSVAFGTLVERYEAKLLRYGRKFLPRAEDIEDIVQDAFVSAYQNIKSFDASRRFSPWIYRIAHNAFVNAIRKHSKSPITMPDFDTFISYHVAEDSPDMEREHVEMKALVEKGLGELPPKSREILVLYYLEEFPYQEIADILQVPLGTVGVRLKRAKEQMRKIYEKMQIKPILDR